MGTFDSSADSPFQIRTEGQEITIRFTRTGPNSGRISWDIPTPALGCSAADQAYNGIIVTLDTTHTSPDKSPVNTTVYTADPTGDSNLHAGDKIGTSLVVGAFYDDKTTTFFDVTGLQADTAYFVSGYAADKVYRYHIEGVHAYSLDYVGDNIVSPTAGNQEVTLGVAGTDATGLLTGTDYAFIIDIDGTKYSITVDGTNTPSYDQLVTEITKNIGKINNPPQGPTPPNTGAYYWNATTEELFQWDGAQHVEVNVIVEVTAPNSPSAGDYWYNPTTLILSKWGGSPLSWVTQTHTKYSQDPTALDGNDYWFNGTNAYIWEGNTWCQKTLWNQATDPTLPVYPTLGTYWYDSVSLLLHQWNDQTNSWNDVDAIYWNVDPNSLTVDTYWFDETNNILKQWNGASWDALTATINSTEPTLPAPNNYWYNPTTEELKQRDVTNTSWSDLTVLAMADDPTNRDSCGWWWDSVGDNLYVWDVTTTSWDLVSTFLQQATDPALPPTMTTADVWYNTTATTLSRWDGSMWVAVTFINSLTDPTIVNIGDVWFDTTNNIWYERAGSPGSWVAFNPVDAIAAPHTPATGTFWFDTTNTALNQWNGVSWVSALFTTLPLTPATGSLWYDTVNEILKEWSGTSYIASTHAAIVELNSDGNLLFTSSTTGSTSSIILTDGDLFASLIRFTGLVDYVVGTDGVDPTPQYQQIGVGDDGTPDERRELMDSIRAQLGYPVVQVELTKYQLDTAITAGLESLRKRSAAAYRRAFFFVDVPAGQQSLRLTNKTVGFNKIVTVMAAYRTNSAFLTTAYEGGIFGQTVIQHLYTMGTFDLLSYHLIASYIETLEDMFATRLVFQWNEQTRQLNFYQSFGYDERILIDASIERTEQELLTDRWTKSWIEKYASAQARLMLAEIRGKYASLPGAGGGVSLNAGELIARAETDMADCYDQLDNFIVNTVEDFGIATTFIVG
jgi:hypothetical protein